MLALTRNKSKEVLDPELLRSTNLLKLREVRNLRSAICELENAEHSFFRSKCCSEQRVAVLEEARRQFHLKHDVLSLKEYGLKEKNLESAQNAGMGKVTTSTKKTSKIASDLIRAKSKIERDYEFSLLKQIAQLRKQHLDLRLRAIQFSYTDDALLENKFVEKQIRSQKNDLEQLEISLLKFQSVDLGNASEDVADGEPQAEEDVGETAKTNEKLALEIKELKRTLKKENKEFEKVEDALSELEEMVLELNNEIIALAKLAERAKEAQKELIEKERNLEELRRKINSLKITSQDQEIELADLVKALESLKEQLPVDPNPNEVSAQLVDELKIDLARTEASIEKASAKLSQLAEEENQALIEQNSLQFRLTESERKQPEIMKDKFDAEVMKDLKEEIKDLTKIVQTLNDKDKDLCAERLSKNKILDKLKAVFKSESERLESKEREAQRRIVALHNCSKVMEELVARRGKIDAENRQLQETITRLEGEIAAVKKEELIKKIQEAAAEAIDLRTQIKELHNKAFSASKQEV